MSSLRKLSALERITDKLPSNFLLIGFIRMILPHAKIVYCVRNPMDNCLSLFKNYFIAPQAFSYSLADLGAFYRCHEGLMSHWLSIFPDWIHTVQYEALVDDLQQQRLDLPRRAEGTRRQVIITITSCCRRREMRECAPPGRR